MKQKSQALLALLTMMAAAVAGCDGARQVEYSPQRAYSADIAASLNRGPTASEPGVSGIQEPLGALPWQIGEHDSDD